ncbi:MAG: hypothetical protein A2885_05660 [Sphingopyxis sp. RIFCSPHIGHO2_01_FULL_65_24]|nr:MAG: hypothetical protein A2885_05660 [Sphingopyxis sp. RIFCSPHIGHO2_01_FULL_65_24]
MNAPVTDQVAAVTSDGPAPARKPTLMLHYDEDHIGLEKRLLFEAASPASALDIAAGEAAGRSARLFVDGAPLCSLLKADDDNPYWVVAAPTARTRADPVSASFEEKP